MPPTRSDKPNIAARNGQKLGQTELDQSSRQIPRNTFLKSFAFAFAGIAYVLRTQRNMRVHFAAGLLVIAAGIVLGVNTAEWGALLTIMALVYALEMINTVAEAIVDMVTEEYHPLAKVAKDVAAGAVLLAALFAVAIALVILLPRFIHLVITLFGW